VAQIGVQLKGNEREIKVRKGMDPQQHDNVQLSVDPFSFRTDKTSTDAQDAFFFVTIVYTTFTLPYSTIAFVVGAALPPIR
jgi:hypothetical protein